MAKRPWTAAEVGRLLRMNDGHPPVADYLAAFPGFSDKRIAFKLFEHGRRFHLPREPFAIITAIKKRARAMNLTNGDLDGICIERRSAGQGNLPKTYWRRESENRLNWGCIAAVVDFMGGRLEAVFDDET